MNKIFVTMNKKFQFLVGLIKIPISVLNFSTESAKEQTIYDLLFFSAVYFSKNVNKKSALYYDHGNYQSFSRFGTHFEL